MFKRILIANRGEIAVRIIRACRDLGVSPVVVYSDADRHSLHVKLADRAFEIGPAEASSSYLAMDKLLETAKRAKVEAIHPGYGFHSENPEFAEKCAQEGIVFVGPSPSAMRIMGDKLASRKAAQQAGVPVMPGSDGPIASVDEGLVLASSTGYPVMLKASGGGGGKGMRLIHSDSDFHSAFQTARGEAVSSFNSATLYLEKYLKRPRHIEIQVLGDHHGGLIHLGERECSIQRRHQKIVEECPSPMVTPKLRAQMGEAALAVARAVEYRGAGTVEFLVDTESDADPKPFYFLEMNTRLQVEHPVTEAATGLDLVCLQLQIAADQPFGLTQGDIELGGWALECRIYAEDPSREFLPCPGTILSFSEPAGPGIRNDCGVLEGYTIPIHYDPLISKIIAHGTSRDQAIARMRRALREYRIGGVTTNLTLFEALLSHPEFQDGNLHTRFLEENGILESLKDLGTEVFSVPLAGAVLHRYFEARRTQGTDSTDRAGWRTFPSLRPPRRGR